MALIFRKSFLVLLLCLSAASTAWGAAPDLIPTVLTAPASVVTEHQMEVSWTVENQGNGEAHAYWYDRLHLSQDDVLDGEDRTLDSFYRTQVLASGGSYTPTRTVTIPKVPAGTYYLIIATDVTNSVYEADETNNVLAAVPVEILTPDLIPTGLTAPASVVTEHRVEVSWTVENQGDGEAHGYWYDRLHLSQDDVLDGEDRTLDSFYRAQVLAVGESYTPTRTVTIPKVPAGTYYLIVATDVTNSVYEADETNNVLAAVPVEILTPDLIPTGLTAPASLVTEHQMEVSWTVENQGNGEAHAYWYDRLHLSQDDVLDGEDRTLDSFYRTQVLASGGSYTPTRTVTIPKVPAGTYYLIVATDVTNSVYEADETNNVLAAVPVEILTPDLIPRVLTAPASVVTEHRVEVSWTVENRGTGEGQASWYDQLYLSEDDVLDGEDRTLDSFYRTQALASGGSYTPTRTVTIPKVPAGTYYLIVATDVTNSVYEADETNNVLAAVPVEILTPDLIPTGLTAPASVVTEHQMEVSWTVENQGDGEAHGYWYDRLHLSQDDVLDGEDRTLDSFYRTQVLAVGGSYTPTRTVTIPKVPAGTYYLIVATDVTNSVYEADETNNVLAAVPVEILTPDLIPRVLTAPASVVTEHRVEVSWTVENRGTGEGQASWYDQLYLSEDDVLDGEDRTLDSFYRTQALASGGSYTPTRTVTIPKVPAGTYYLIVATDVTNSVYEADETNNVTSWEIYVSAIEAFRIVAIAPAATGRLRLDFTNDAGRMYGLESRDSMGEGDWSAEQFFLSEDGTEPRSDILGTGDVLSIYVEPTASRGFYRMVGQ